jgi:hypothetical protein
MIPQNHEVATCSAAKKLHQRGGYYLRADRPRQEKMIFLTKSKAKARYQLARQFFGYIFRSIFSI